MKEFKRRRSSYVTREREVRAEADTEAGFAGEERRETAQCASATGDDDDDGSERGKGNL